MARRSSRRSRNRPGTARSLHPIARRSLHVPTISIRPLDLRVFEDRRRFDPFVPVRFAPWPKRVVRGGALPAQVRESRNVPSRMSFAVPGSVAICVRRKRRREVLFANGGRRAGARAAKRRNQWSDVKC